MRATGCLRIAQDGQARGSGDRCCPRPERRCGSEDVRRIQNSRRPPDDAFRSAPMKTRAVVAFFFVGLLACSRKEAAPSARKQEAATAPAPATPAVPSVVYDLRVADPAYKDRVLRGF